MGGIWVALFRIAVDFILDRRTDATVERELNEQFRQFEQEVNTHSGGTVTLQLESITVRPKYRPKSVGNGIQRVEMLSGFSEYDENREEASRRERIAAIISGTWVTRVRFRITDGSVEDIRPEGFSLSYVTTRLGYHEAGRQIRAVETNEYESDKLEMKIVYDGSVGEYRRELLSALDVLEGVQEDMELHVLMMLIRLHYSDAVDSGKSMDSVKRKWEDNEQVAKLGEYLFEETVNPALLAGMIGEVRAEIENSEQV